MLIRSTDLGQQVRKYVLDHFLEFSVPPVVEQIMKRFRFGRTQAVEVLQWLEAARHVRFFRGTSHIDDWRSENPASFDAALTIEQTDALSVPLYRDRLKLEYVRPSKDELVAHFAALGLKGPFWDL